MTRAKMKFVMEIIRTCAGVIAVCINLAIFARLMGFWH